MEGNGDMIVVKLSSNQLYILSDRSYGLNSNSRCVLCQVADI